MQSTYVCLFYYTCNYIARARRLIQAYNAYKARSYYEMMHIFTVARTAASCVVVTADDKKKLYRKWFTDRCLQR